MAIESEALLQGVLDREAIRDLPLRYCHCVWQKDLDSWVNLFTSDGSISASDPKLAGAAKGHDELRKMIGSGLETMKPRPFIHNHVINLLGPDRAAGTCYVEVRMIRDGKNWSLRGWYDDEYAKAGGEWKFKSRRINVDSFAPSE
ncbi:MAG: nuclear transport factor 2 family protein [Candidatus Binataceae bacterium]|jgi:hypothetical protein